VTVSTLAPITGWYDYAEVARSVLIAIAASYVALDLTGRVTAARGRARLAWLSGGALAMGIGIWAMHMKGMLAFHLPVSVEYHWPTILTSLSAGILASALALYLSSRQKMGWVEALTGSLIMGAGITALHYIAMAAMRLPAITRYSPLLVTASLLLAVLFSLIALLMAFDLREETRWTVPRRLGSAIVMGAAISAMHYTGMAAASFVPAPPPDLSHAVNISAVGNNGIAAVTLIVLMAALVTSSVDRRATVEFERVNQELERLVAERTRQLAAANQVLRKEIAERKQAEEALRTSEREQHKIAQQLETERARLIEAQAVAKVGSWEIELPSLDLTWSEQTHHIFETDPSYFHPTRLGFVEHVHPQDRAKVDAAFEASLEEGAPSTVEYRVVMADGRVKVLEEHWKVFHDGQGRPTRLVGTCQDITERKRAEQELQESQAALARVARIATIGELTASIAHEINQPLAAVATNASASLRWLAVHPPNLDEARQAMASAMNEANRASGVIQKLRTMLKKVPPQPRPVDVNEIIRDVLALVHRELISGGITPRTELEPDLPTVLGDRVQLQQVMLNLIMNALDAMATVNDRPRMLLIKSARDAEGVVIEVHDSGKGLDPEQASRIFDSFFTTKPEGIGMGLSISRSIVEAHGGRLQGVPGSSAGAVFQVILPKAA
jgi:NO-binding membrane sensor protein with MHYT domain/signal transduction histidine kinase